MLKKRAFGAMVLVLLALVVVWILVPAQGQKEKSVEVWVAKETIPAGEEAISNKNLLKVKVPEAESWMITDPEKLKGKRSVRAILAGRFIDESDFEEDMPIVFQDGEGEYTIKAKPEYVNGGRINPGDTVSVIYVPREAATSDGFIRAERGESKVRGVTVLSIRTQYAQDVDETNKKSDINNVPASIVLKVTEDQAAVLAAQQENGTLSLFVTRRGNGQHE